MEIKIQLTLRDEVAEKFSASMKRNYRTMAGEAAFRITESLRREDDTIQEPSGHALAGGEV